MHKAGLRTPVWKPEHRELTPTVVQQVLPGAQRAFNLAHAASRFSRLLDSFAADRRQRDLARLRSLACRAAAIWLDTTPYNETVRVGDYAVRVGLRHMLGISHLPRNAHSLTCACGQRLRAGDCDHFMVCRSQTHRWWLHDQIGEAIRGIMGSAGVASSREPRVRDLRGGEQARRAQQPGARMDIVFNIEPDGLSAVDQSVVHPAAESYSAAAALNAGAAADLRDGQKRTAYATADPHGYHFTPFSVESYGRLGKPAMHLLRKLAAVAGQTPGVHAFDVKKFMEMALKRLSVTLCNGIARLCRSQAQRLVANVGLNHNPGCVDPVDDEGPP